MTTTGSAQMALQGSNQNIFNLFSGSYYLIVNDHVWMFIHNIVHINF